MTACMAASPTAGSGAELCYQRVALGASLRLPLGIAVDQGVVQLVVQLSETAPILSERFAIEQGTCDVLCQRGGLTTPIR